MGQKRKVGPDIIRNVNVKKNTGRNNDLRAEKSGRIEDGDKS